MRMRSLSFGFAAILVLVPLAFSQPIPRAAHYLGEGLTTACMQTPDWQRGWGASWIAGCIFVVVPGDAHVFVQDAWSHDVPFSWISRGSAGEVCGEGSSIGDAALAVEAPCDYLQVVPEFPAVAGEVIVT